MTRTCNGLRAILDTAVADELLPRNPYTARGAGVSHAAERTVATLAQVDALADAVPPRYRMLVLLAAWSGARWGELVALTRDSLDLNRGTLTIDRQYVELRDGSLILGTPKTAAGVRTVHIPPHLLPGLREHLELHTTAVSPVVFLHSKDQPIRRASWWSVWLLARNRAGLPRFRFRDLGHTGNTLAAATGASTKELMARMGHASFRAALIYQHATTDRDAALAAALSGVATGCGTTPEAAAGGRRSPSLHASGRARPRTTGTQRAGKDHRDGTGGSVAGVIGAVGGGQRGEGLRSGRGPGGVGRRPWASLTALDQRRFRRSSEPAATGDDAGGGVQDPVAQRLGLC